MNFARSRSFSISIHLLSHQQYQHRFYPAIGSWRRPLVLQGLLWLLFTVFLRLTIANAVDNWGSPQGGHVLVRIAGYFGIVMGSLAFYLSAAELNGYPTIPPKNPFSTAKFGDIDFPA